MLTMLVMLGARLLMLMMPTCAGACHEGPRHKGNATRGLFGYHERTLGSRRPLILGLPPLTEVFPDRTPSPSL